MERVAELPAPGSNALKHRRKSAPVVTGTHQPRLILSLSKDAPPSGPSLPGFAGRPTLAALFAAAALALAGCGFKPLYGNVPGSVSSEELAAVDIGLIGDRSGQILRNRLVTRMHPLGMDGAPVYLLDVDLSESSVGIAVETDETATRTNLTITARIALTALDAGEVVYVDSVSTYASYDILTAEYATLTAERDARERALLALADRIATSVALYLQRAG